MTDGERLLKEIEWAVEAFQAAVVDRNNAEARFHERRVRLLNLVREATTPAAPATSVLTASTVSTWSCPNE